MSPSEFLTAVLPAEGKYCVFTMNGEYRKNIFMEGTENVLATVQRMNQQDRDAWFALGGFDGAGRRRAENALYMRSLFIDLDCGLDAKTGKPRAFGSKKIAVQALGEFLKASKLDELGAPWLVDSGNGVHVYWPLDTDTPVSVWKPVATSLLSAAAKLAFPIDANVTGDAARVLRVPGSLNMKYDPPKDVVLRHTGGVFHLDDIAERLNTISVTYPAPALRRVDTPLAITGTAPAPAGNSLAVRQALVNNSATKFKNIIVRTAEGTGCGQLTYYIDNAKQEGMEPLWRAWLSIAKVCDDGEKASLRLTQMHPYSEERMQRKLSEIKGPYPCRVFNELNGGICENCPSWGKITNPLALGREVLTTTEEIKVETNQGTHVLRPPPPPGFVYGANGGVYYKRKAEKANEEDKLILLTTYDIFMTRMFRDETVYKSEFMAIKGDRKVTFVIPNSFLGSQSELVKALAANNILAAFGTSCDKYLAEYIRACVTDISNAERTVNIPPHFGWQEDGSFAVGDTVFSPFGAQHDYSYTSDRLHNVIHATRTSGTLERWRSVYHMLREKGLWGHLAFAGVGFGTAMMHFMPAGSRACTFLISGTTSGGGKTLAMTMANSVWGEHLKYNIAASTSERTMMQRAGLWGSLHLSIDEITNKDRASNREWVPMFLFDFAAGTHKIKGVASGNSEVQHHVTWESLAILSTNAPALEAMVGARKHTSHGEVRRFIEWNLRPGYEVQWTPEERVVLHNLENNFGIAGREFITYCVRNQDTVRKVCYEAVEYWRKVSGATDVERFWTAGAAAIIAGYIIAGPKHANIVEIPVSKIVDFLLKRVKIMRETIEKTKLSAWDVLNSYIREFNGNFVRIQGSNVAGIQLNKLAVHPASTKGPVRGRVEFEVRHGMVDIYIEEKMLRMHCADMNRSYNDLMREIQKTATTTMLRKDLLQDTNSAPLRVQCLLISRPTSEVGSEF